MNFAFSEEQLLLRDSTRRFLADRHPLGAVREKLEAPSTFDPAVWREGSALGWTAMLVPEEHEGGSVTGQPVVDAVALAEELGRVLYPGPFLPTNVVADAIASRGTDDQRKRHLAPIARGETVAAWCLSADGRPDLGSVDVTARSVDVTARSVDVTARSVDGAASSAGASPSGGWSLDGVARFVQDASVADLLLVACRTPWGPAQALVPAGADGVATRVLGGLDLTRRFCEVRFSGVRVGPDDVLAVGADAEAAADRALRLATVLQAAGSVGAADELFLRTVQYAKDRVQFGRAIGSFQAVKHKLANLLIELEGARAATHYAALALSDDMPDRDEAVAVVGSYVRDACAHLAGEALQTHGGIGFTWEGDVHLYVRRAKTEQLLYGDPAWHRERLCSIVEQSVPETAGEG